VFGFSKVPDWPTGFRRALPILAILTCAAFYVGLIAAMRASTFVQNNWNAKFEDREGYKDALLAGSESTRQRGRIPATFVPPLFMIAWLTAFTYDILQVD
jgi:hypothetical protein